MPKLIASGGRSAVLNPRAVSGAEAEQEAGQGAGLGVGREAGVGTAELPMGLEVRMGIIVDIRRILLLGFPDSLTGCLSNTGKGLRSSHA